MPAKNSAIRMLNKCKFNVAGDSTNLLTAASAYGRHICDCKSRGINDCSCPRYFSDPNATWGWDSTYEYYFFGHVFHLFTASDSPNDLPIIIKPVFAKRFDGVTGVFAFKELIDLYSEITFYSLLLIRFMTLQVFTGLSLITRLHRLLTSMSVIRKLCLCLKALMTKDTLFAKVITG